MNSYSKTAPFVSDNTLKANLSVMSASSYYTFLSGTQRLFSVKYVSFTYSFEFEAYLIISLRLS